MPNNDYLKSPILDFRISPELQGSAEIKQKLIKINRGTLILAKNTKLQYERLFFFIF